MKILIVDDSQFSRNMLRRILEGQSRTLIEASSGEQSLDLYSREKPDLVFLDLVMPGMRGLEVLSRLRELDPEARIVIASADVQNTTRQEALELGALQYIKKPFQENEILALLERFQG